MSEVKVHKVKYRLAQQLRTGAMLSTATALGSAKDRVRKIEPALLAAIDDEIAGMDEAMGVLKDGDATAIGRLYAAANRLLGLAGAAVRLAGLGKAALSLCELLDGLDGSAPADLRPIAVHIDALRILRTDLPERDQFIVLGGLSKVRSHKPKRAEG